MSKWIELQGSFYNLELCTQIYCIDEEKIIVLHFSDGTIPTALQHMNEEDYRCGIVFFRKKLGF